MKRFLCLMMGLAAVGCGEEGQPPPIVETGQLGSINFTYGCLNASDPVCDTLCDESDASELCADKTFDIDEIPIVAVGSSFTLESSNTGVTLVPATADRLEVDGDTITATKAGISSLMAMNPDGTIEDFVDIRVAEVDTIDVDFTLTYNTTDAIFEGYARILLLGDEATPIGGSFDCTWTTTDAAVVSIGGDATDNMVAIATGTPGAATLDVTYGPHAGSLDITVNSQ